MFDWLRQREREESQLEKVVADIENPADPNLAERGQGIAPSAKNAAWAVAIGAVVVLIVAAISVLIGLRFGRPA